METDLDELRDQVLIVFHLVIPPEFYSKMSLASLILVQRSDLSFKITKSRHVDCRGSQDILKLTEICPSLSFQDDFTIEMNKTDLAKLRLLWN